MFLLGPMSTFRSDSSCLETKRTKSQDCRDTPLITARDDINAPQTTLRTNRSNRFELPFKITNVEVVQPKNEPRIEQGHFILNQYGKGSERGPLFGLGSSRGSECASSLTDRQTMKNQQSLESNQDVRESVNKQFHMELIEPADIGAKRAQRKHMAFFLIVMSRSSQ